VIIVGAGPGGLKCAEVLGKKGKKVLLLEKNKRIGPKICAGGLTRKALRALGAPSELIEKQSDSLFFVSPHQRTRLKFGDDLFYTIDREVLGQWQLKKLDEYSNVEVEISTEITSIKKECVITNKNETILFDRLIGADGSNSIVRKFLKLESERIGLAFHYLVPIDRCEKLTDAEIHFDSELFSAWYSWIFPHKKYVSAGYGFYPKYIKFSDARESLLRWLRRMNINVEGCQFHSFPINCDYRGFSFGNRKYFLIGDAAGLASGLTGEGICQAVISGVDVANKIIDEKYECKGIKKLLREKKVHNFMLRSIGILLIFKNTVFEVVTFATKSKKLARILLRILT